ncbi:MAG: SAM-dependent methyltransferase, partial [Acidobacteriota bacterium]|nr:SAM-dependent methyltransferase [Acidobacteriota bacterium]
LENFHDKLAGLKFFDPACGCGNFLIISYRELRLLEIEILKSLRKDYQLSLDVAHMSKIDVDQFYGIELGEFPVRIAEIALWMMDHIMNNRLSLEFGESFVRIPLKKSPHIHHADALEHSWAAVIPPADCSYVLGNPPFGGAKYQSIQQREQVRRIADLGGSGGTLDHVAAWFLRAGEYLKQSRAKIGFVATNSITQGEQVAQLWPVLFDRYDMEISFAHRTFAWGSDARGVAHVHVVIVGLCRRDMEPSTKRLFSYPDIKADPIESHHNALAPYLFDAGTVNNRHLVVREAPTPINGAPKMIIGSKPIDGGYLILDDEERAQFVAEEPQAAQFLRPYIGAVEYLYSRGRWILALQKATPVQLRALPAVLERLKQVREYRRGERPARKKQDDEGEIKTPGISARALANTPAEFHVTVIPESPFLAIPEVSSETRDYLPKGWLEPPVIPSNKLRFIKNASLWHFGVLTSAMHMAWLRDVGGRLESRFQYGIHVVYNTFPWPVATDKQKEKISQLAKAILDARAAYPESSLADLYDATLMKRDLRQAHQALDAAVDRLYRGAAFNSDRDRAEHLFGLYEQLVAPLMVGQSTRRPRKRTQAELLTERQHRNADFE